MVLPTGQAVGVEDVEKICAIIRAALSQSAVVRATFAKRSANDLTSGLPLPTSE
jgi:hypothetical protein